jgi:UDP-N-acetylglucosamine 2-epimerase (non-hydrolysing)
VKRILLVIGTRPETIKMAPVYHALKQEAWCETVVCSTGQHRHLLDQMTAFFEVQTDLDLEVMAPGQDLFDVTSQVLLKMRGVLQDVKPDLLLVQGDTTTVMASAMAAFYSGIPVGHVEAGLRTWNMANPFPEEFNRIATDAISTIHFAPTALAKETLLKNQVSEDSIHVTGNTVIDALSYTLNKLEGDPFAALDLSSMGRVILLTTHRRESFGEPMRRVFNAVKKITNAYPDVHFVYPAHPNPCVQEAIAEHLQGTQRVSILEPQPYPEFVKLLRDCHMVLTDSGGVQEEAPSLGKPVLVLRETTERPEGISAGTAMLVGTDPERIVAETARLLDDEAAYGQMAQAVTPYGDGQSTQRIVKAIREQ